MSAAEQASIREALGDADWRAAMFLRDKLDRGELRALYGKTARLLLGMEGERLAAFCTLAERDEIETDLKPWIGFVYVFPAFRGRRRSGAMIESACTLAKRDGYSCVYLSSREVGLYEKYGFDFIAMARDTWGEETRVYRKSFGP